MRPLTYDEVFQLYVDANELLRDAIRALEEIKASKMPGESRRIAILFLKAVGDRDTRAASTTSA